MTAKKLVEILQRVPPECIVMTSQDGHEYNAINSVEVTYKDGEQPPAVVIF